MANRAKARGAKLESLKPFGHGSQLPKNDRGIFSRPFLFSTDPWFRPWVFYFAEKKDGR